MVAGWHKRKSEIFQELVMSGALPGRPGVSGSRRTHSTAAGRSPSAPRPHWRRCRQFSTASWASNCQPVCRRLRRRYRQGQEAGAGHLQLMRPMSRSRARPLRGRRGFEERSAGRDRRRHGVSHHVQRADQERGLLRSGDRRLESRRSWGEPATVAANRSRARPIGPRSPSRNLEAILSGVSVS